MIPVKSDLKKRWQSYHTMWVWLLLGWTFSAADRGLTGPVVTWMIDHHVAFFQGVSNPHALGGLIGGLFFAAFMLTQFPGGYIGDKFGHRTTIVLSLLWAGLSTLFGGLMYTLIGFIALRVITGLGEGMFYSNDRSIIAEVTPIEKRSMAMGVVITGLTFGVTLAYLFTALMTNWGDKLLGQGHGWQAPFLIFGFLTLCIGGGLQRYFKRENKEKLQIGTAFISSVKFFLPFFVIVMAVYFLSEKLHINNTMTAVIEIIVALCVIVFAYTKLGGELAPVLRNKDLVLLYVSAFPFLWVLWFFNFWSGDIISKAGHSSFLVSALLYALFNAGAGILGFPIGGWLADLAYRKGYGRKRIYLFFIPVQSIMTFIFGFYLLNGGHSLVVMSFLLFFCNLFLNIVQPISQAMTADIAEEKHRGSAFGMWNLIAEMGAVLSPVVSGALMDVTGKWYPAIFLGGGLMFVTIFTVAFVREGQRLKQSHKSVA
jgi:ACS family D-galactonate transporter-like MFS transporter